MKCSLFLILSAVLSLLVPPAQAEDLVLKDDEIRELTSGTHSFELITLGRNSTILLSGTTDLLAKKMVIDTEARIEYKPSSDIDNDAKHLEFVVLDGSDMKGVLIINGSGAAGRHGADGANGRNGDSEHTKTDICYKRKLGVKIPYPCIRHTDPTPGEHGGNGKNGFNGEDAMDIDVSMYKLNPNVYVTLLANGGNGGDGGNGGNGGDGGRGKRIERGRDGGNGGNGGDGGNGGNAGNINVLLVYREGTSESELYRLRKVLAENILAKPGVGGYGGRAGDGGTGGDGGLGGRIGGEDVGIKRGSGKGGASGTNGGSGSKGNDSEISKELIEAKKWLEWKKRTIEKLLK